jgi:hypothetical protein
MSIGDYELDHRADLDGHHIWRAWLTGRLVISDHSADNRDGDPGSPDWTDDGALYVDFGRPAIRLGLGYMVPVKTERGEARWVSSSLAEVHRLEALHGGRFGDAP